MLALDTTGSNSDHLSIHSVPGGKSLEFPFRARFGIVREGRGDRHTLLPCDFVQIEW
jgi:hypothetical protein